MKIRIYYYLGTPLRPSVPSVPCHQMIQVCNSKAEGAEGAALGARRVRCPVQNVILCTKLQFGQSTTSGAPSARRYTCVGTRRYTCVIIVIKIEWKI